MVRKTASVLFVICWMALPLQAGVSVAGKLHHEQSALAGESYNGVIVLKNYDDKPQDVKLYQTDYLFYANGTSDFGDPGEDLRTNAAWIKLGTSRTTIPPDGSVNINFRVEVPPEKPLIGSYWSVIMIESIPGESPESSTADNSQLNVGLLQVIRYAYQVVTNIGDTGSRMLKFMDTKLSREEEKVILALDVESSGERSVRAQLTCELYDSQGNFVEKFDGGSHRLHPGTSRKYKVDLTGIPGARYKALVIIDCGDDYVFGKNINLVL